jgi:hypothetical protein
MPSNFRAAVATAALFAAVFAPTASAADDTAGYKEDQAPATTKLERFHLKRANCAWTQEMGRLMFECLKANFNMNAHWCHNEVMEIGCGDVEGAGAAAAPTPAAGTAKAN